MRRAAALAMLGLAAAFRVAAAPTSSSDISAAANLMSGSAA